MLGGSARERYCIKHNLLQRILNNLPNSYENIKHRGSDIKYIEDAFVLRIVSGLYDSLEIEYCVLKKYTTYKLGKWRHPHVDNLWIVTNADAFKIPVIVGRLLLLSSNVSQNRQLQSIYMHRVSVRYSGSVMPLPRSLDH